MKSLKNIWEQIKRSPFLKGDNMFKLSAIAILYIFGVCLLKLFDVISFKSEMILVLPVIIPAVIYYVYRIME